MNEALGLVLVVCFIGGGIWAIVQMTQNNDD